MIHRLWSGVLVASSLAWACPTLAQDEGKNEGVRALSGDKPAAIVPPESAPAGSDPSEGFVTEKATALSKVNAPATPPQSAPAVNPLLRRDETPSSGTRLRTLGWVGVGVGAASVAVGVASLILAAAKNSDLNDKCRNLVCDSQQGSELNQYQTLRTVSTVGFIAGGVAAAAGVILLLRNPKSERPQLGLLLTPSAAALRGEF